MDEEGKGFLDEEASFNAEEAARGEVRPGDEPRLVEGQVTDRGEIVEICILAARLFQLLPGPAKLLVLHLKLDLMDGELMNELLQVRPGHESQFLGRFGE